MLRELPYLGAIVLVLVIGALTGPGASAPRTAAPSAEQISLRERMTPSGKLSVLDLEVGDCLNDVPAGPSEVDAVLCREPHDVEVFAVFDLDFVSWPGTGTVERHAQHRCDTRLERDDPSTEASARALYPSKRAWIDDADHEVVCLAEYASPKRGRQTP
jgi:hypothetical protein